MKSPLRFWKKHARLISTLLAAVPQGELARLLGVTRQTLRAWRRDGLPASVSAGHTAFDLTAVLTWFRARAEARPPAAQAEGTSEAALRAEKLRSLRRENDFAEGKLVRRDLVIRVADEQTLAFREGLQDLDERAAVALGKCKTAAERLDYLQGEHGKLCARFSRAMKEGAAV